MPWHLFLMPAEAPIAQQLEREGCSLRHQEAALLLQGLPAAHIPGQVTE